jgi:transposase
VHQYRYDAYLSASTARTIPQYATLGQRALWRGHRQHNKTVKALAQQLDITLLFLPPYSPNLNLIERLWRFIKQKCLTNIYHENVACFQKAIHNTLDQINNNAEYQQQLKSLLTLRFQRFNNHQSIP